jgi:peptidoglycan/xylan/chitin deacetylase (PgdA/CDA1 family)
MQRTSWDMSIIIITLFTIVLCTLSMILARDYMQPVFAYQTTMTKSQPNNNISNPPRPTPTTAASSSTDKVVILNFYDDDKSQFTNAKPILDKYGFKGTFFIVCNWANSDNKSRMTWQDISQLYREGYDIESHSMTHKRLNKLSTSALDYEVG